MKPIEIDPPKEILEALYPAVGELVIAWSILEQATEHWVAMIYHHPAGNKNSRTIPFLLTAKLEFLRTRFAEMPDLQPFAAQGLDILAKIDGLAEIRDMMVHGTISSYQPDSQLLKFIRLPIDKPSQIHKVTPEYISVPQILEAGRMTLSTMTEALNFSHKLLDNFVGQNRVNDAPCGE